MKTLLALLWLPAAAAAGILELTPGGSLKIDGTATLGLAHYTAKNWTSQTRHADSWRPERDGNTFRGGWKLRGEPTPVRCELHIEQPAPEHWHLTWSLKAAKPVETQTLAVQLELPVEAEPPAALAGKPVWIGGKTASFPKEPVANGTVFRGNGTELRLPLRDGLLTLKTARAAELRLLDFRVWNSPTYAVRFSLPFDRAGAFQEAEFSLEAKFEPWRIEPVDLTAACNMGFRDETAGDGRGGWTDQGPEHDLRDLKPGELRQGPFRFSLTEHCVVLGRNFPKRATIPMGGKTVRRLYLVHAAAWPPPAGTELGRIHCRFTDGGSAEIPVTAGTDVDNWWNGSTLANAPVIWSSERAGWFARLGMAAFAIPARPLQSVGFTVTGQGMWMIAAASVSPDEIPLTRYENEIVRPGADWRPFPVDPEVQAGSALDFSFLLEPPDSEPERVVAHGGELRLEKSGRPIRFYGTNLGYTANYMSHQEADRLSERFRRIGYNAVRLHLFDRDLVKRGAGSSAKLDPEQLDKLDYFAYALQRRGIRFTIDLFSGRPWQRGEFKALPEFTSDRDYKLGVILYPEMRDNLKAFSRALLGHRNPYTGSRWAQEPSLLLVNLVNENTPLHQIRMISGPLREAFDRKFDAWRREHPGSPDREREYRRFLGELYREFYNDMKTFLRKLGVTAPLTDQNYIASPNAAADRALLDVVDLHLYGDHPEYPGRPWQPPARFGNRSQLARRLKAPLELAPARLFGKPFMVTEFDICYPNEFRSEGAVLFGAFAAQQGWSGLFRFDYAGHHRGLFGKPDLRCFETAHDPVRMLSERIGLAAFLRGDVAAAREKFEIAVAPDCMGSYLPTYPDEYEQLALHGRVGTVLADANAGPAAPGPVRPGELAADYAAGTFRMVTPRSEAAVLPEKQALAGAVLRVRAERSFATVAAIALDDRPLAESDRILLLHLTDNRLEGMEFKSGHGLTIYRDGSGRMLGRKGTASFALALPEKTWKLHALDCSGRRLAEIPFRREQGELRFTADTFQVPDQVVFAYELTAQRRRNSARPVTR
ncbi:hypothetical protein [Victivallis vadensis]|uniref:hypothetical protein n=1 Tax=Victivallis vadensis TaxID=172901 RepID=UPI002595B067|nr:hypothetical protein [Victivallis vadensis]